MKRWATKPLSELCDVEGGNAAPQGDENFKEGKIPFVRMKDLGRYHITNNLTQTDDKLTEASAANNRMKLFGPGCILFPRSGSVALNHRAILGVRACIVSHIGVLQNLRPEITAGYLYLYLTTFDMTALAKKTTGVDSIAFADVKRIPVPVPPLAEQEGIVKLLKQADQLLKLRAKADRRTAELIPALFHEMFGDPTINRKGWPLASFERTFVDHTSRCPKLKQIAYQSCGRYPIVGQGQQFIAGYTDDKALVSEIRQPVVVFGDHTRAVKLVNFSFVVGADGAKVLVPQAGFNAAFLVALLQALPIPDLGYSRHMREVKRLAFLQPPLELQKEFAKHVTEIRELEAEQAASRLRLEALFQSLLHHAFNGEL